MNVIPFGPGSEAVTAVIHLSNNGGEAFIGPLVIGYYKDSDEIWIDQEGQRVQIPAEHFKAFVRQLRRANQIAVDEQEEAKC